MFENWLLLDSFPTQGNLILIACTGKFWQFLSEGTENERTYDAKYFLSG